MEDKIIKCDLIVKEIKDEIKEFVSGLKKSNIRVPSLCIISVGNDSASESYIKGKVKDCEYTGINVNVVKYDSMVTENELCKKIDEICKDSSIDGLIVQLPLPKHIDSKEIAKHIKKEYDVDGFTEENTALLWSKDTVKNKNNNSIMYPCTPYGISYLLDKIGYSDLSNKKAVIVGRSDIVGKPMIKFLLDKNATVSICHSKTEKFQLMQECLSADILICAVGKAKMINRNYIKRNAVVIDVGINRDENGKLCGDVDLDNVLDLVKYITPVPKGVGLLTRAMLLKNIIKSYKKKEVIYKKRNSATFFVGNCKFNADLLNDFKNFENKEWKFETVKDDTGNVAVINDANTVSNGVDMINNRIDNIESKIKNMNKRKNHWGIRR